MPHACLIDNAAQAPAYQPPAGAQSIAALEAGRADYRSPDTGSQARQMPTDEPTQAPPWYVRPPGVPRALRNPQAFLVRLVRGYDGKGTQDTGQHLDIEAGASSPQGEQRPPRAGTARGNTFRAAPAPWDAATFAAYTEG